MKGRAEYEDISGKRLFEGETAISRYPWVAEEGEGKGMIVAERGMGKTFFARKLASEIPSDFYILDKNTFDYKILDEVSSPKLIIADDLHYQLQAMRLGRLENKKMRDEEEVLEILKNLDREAKEKKAKIIYISDEGPSGLVNNFQDEKHKKEFLELLDGCVATGDDASVFIKYLDKYHSNVGNVYNFRSQINEYLALNIRKELGMKDVPLMVPQGLLTRPPSNNSRFKSNRLEDRNDLIFIVPSDKMEITEWKSPEGWMEIWPENICRYRYGIGRKRLPLKDDPIKMYRLDGQKLIAPIRELKVVKDELGEVSIKSLGINFEVNSTGKETIYKPSDIWKIPEYIHKKYSEIAGRDMMPLAKALLTAKDESEFSAHFIRCELQKE